LHRYLPANSSIRAQIEPFVENIKSTLMEPEDTTWILGEVDREKQLDAEKSKVDQSKPKTEEKGAEQGESKEVTSEKTAEHEDRLAKEKQRLEALRVEGVLPEVEIFMSLLLVMHLIDKAHLELAAKFIENRLERISQPTFNRRTLDLLTAKIYSYYSLVNERLGRLADIRPRLLDLHRSACLRHDEPGQTALTNAILRNFIHFNAYTQADQFRSNLQTTEPRSPSQHAQYLYYTGQINAIQLHYSDAYNNLTLALRKAPQTAALGFRQSAQKLLVIVQLLMGEIPERALFRQPGLKRSLAPYLQLTKAVRVGDLDSFRKVMTEFKSNFVADKTYGLIVRVRHTVIKAGLRKICLSYSKISLRDISCKLSLEREEDTENIVAKAIHDGVIDAVIDRENQVVCSRERADIYVTQEPQKAFHKRIQFCVQVHNDAVKALRFPPNAVKHAKNDSLDDDDADFEDI